MTTSAIPADTLAYMRGCDLLESANRSAISGTIDAGFITAMHAYRDAVAAEARAEVEARIKRAFDRLAEEVRRG